MRFIWGNDYSPGDSILDSSEKPLPRGKGKVRIDVILVKTENTNQAHIS